MTSAALPVGEPNVVPMGVYYATIKGEVAEKASTFDPSRTFYTLPLALRSTSGEDFDFTWAFGPRNPAYIKFLELLGGQKSPSGKTIPPTTYQGRTFMIKLGEQMNKDKTRTINSVLEVWAAAGTAPEDHEDGVPF